MRKIVKHGPSSYIVSLPLQWVSRFNLEKGDEVNVEQSGYNIIISPQSMDITEHIDLNASETKDMTVEVISALYKRGVDEVRITYSKPEEFSLIMAAVEYDSISYEIISTTKNSCTLKSITKLTNEFDNVLRRIFLVTLSLAEEGVKSIHEKNFDTLSNIAILEKSNNKLTTFCRRFLNKHRVEGYDMIGPLYFVIELMEKIADEYRYMFDSISSEKFDKVSLNKNLVIIHGKITEMLRLFYECFYKTDYSKINRIKTIRSQLLKELENITPSLKNKADISLHHHAINLVRLIFSLVDPYMIIAFKKQ